MSTPATHPQSQRSQRRWRRRLLRAGALTVATPLLLLLLFRMAVAFWPYPEGLDRPPSPSTLFYDRTGVELAAIASDADTWHISLTAEQISPHLVHAIVAVEDRRFYSHGGVDWPAAASAVWQNATALRIRRGASTLTMQVQRLRDPQIRSLAGKFEQAVRACQLEKSLTKQQIVTEYLNRAPFGANLVGAGAASRQYFGIPCRNLTLAQAALLAGLPQRPSQLRPDRHPELALVRRNHVLRCMFECGYITQQEHDAARAEPVVASWHPLPQDRIGTIPHADGALPTLLRIAGRATAGEVRTTLDPNLQRQAAAAANDALASMGPSQVDTAAIVVLDTRSAECRASVSLTRGLSPAVDFTAQRRSTGSVLKPFIYAAAFDAGTCSPGEILIDLPAAWPGYAPGNYDRHFAGRMTAADALAQSRNIPALLVLEKVGVTEAVSLMEKLGLAGLARSRRIYGLSLAIGGAEASPIEIAQAYAALARDGLARPVRYLARETDRTTFPGNASDHQTPVAWASRPWCRYSDTLEIVSTPAIASDVKHAQAYLPMPPKIEGQAPAAAGIPVLSPATCRATLAALSTYARTAPISRRAAGLGIAWKTGTSSGHRDAWCAAVNDRYTVVVWLGNSAGHGAIALVGQEAAAPVALNLLAAIDGRGSDAQIRVPTPVRPIVRTTNTPSAAPVSASRIIIVSPSPAEEFVLSSDLDLAQQKILFRAMLRGGNNGFDTADGTLWWFVDGTPLGQHPADVAVPWTPSTGSHEVRAIDLDGRTASVRFVVRQ